MSRNLHSASIPWGALFFALLGLAWCGYVAFPSASTPDCLTSGCYLLRDGSIGGISLWWIGGAYFFVLAVICLRGARRLAWNLSRLALLMDCLLLFLMYFTGPCVDCLVVALLLAITCFLARPGGEGWFLEGPATPVLLPIWLGLFLGNACLAMNEYVSPLTIANQDNRAVRLYFSPSCVHCREALLVIGDTAALYPIKEQDGDLEAIVKLRSYLQAKVPMDEAIRRSLDTDEPMPPFSALARLGLEIQLLRNKAAVLRQGFDSMPLILINGLPSGLSPAPARPRTGSGPGLPAEILPMDQDLNFLEDLTNLGSCGGGTEEPCD